MIMNLISFSDVIFTLPCFYKCYFDKELFSVINSLGTSLFELQINFAVLQIDTENSATGHKCRKMNGKVNT